MSVSYPENLGASFHISILFIYLFGKLKLGAFICRFIEVICIEYINGNYVLPALPNLDQFTGLR